MDRVYNFSAGPAVLPEEVLREAADEMMKLAQEHASLRWGIRLKEFFRKWKDHDVYNP